MFITKNYKDCWIAGGEAWDELSLRSLRRNQSCPHLEFRLLDHVLWFKATQFDCSVVAAQGDEYICQFVLLTSCHPPKPWEGQEFRLVYSLCVSQSRPIVGAQ